MVKSHKHRKYNGDKQQQSANNGLFKNHVGNGNGNGLNAGKYRKLLSMGKISTDIIKDLYNPVDATNRFINLALQNLDEDSQGRQFLLESKSGIRRMSSLLNRLSKYAKKMEKTLQEAGADSA